MSMLFPNQRARDAFLFPEPLQPRPQGSKAVSPSEICAALCLPHVKGFQQRASKMPSKLSKVQKHVRKKKGDKINSLHENSRDAQRLRRASSRDERVSRLKAVRGHLNRRWIDRIVFLSERLPDTLHPQSTDDMRRLVEQYLSRLDEELVRLRSERRPGRPPSTRQTLLEQQKKTDEQEYDSGFWLPNLHDEETLLKLESWQGDWGGLATMRFIRLSKNGEPKESQFPPRGAS